VAGGGIGVAAAAANRGLLGGGAANFLRELGYTVTQQGSGKLV